ncbi:MAG: hypothetical protein ACREMW_10770, partial [Gemmatimonadales bacterium]
MSRTTATIGGEGRLHAASAAWYANADSDAISTAVLADALARHLLEEAQLRDADFVVRPKAHVSNFADFSNPGALIAAGERAAQETLPQI